MNDKHSAEPPKYRCQFSPCPYESKRESNYKQHMEKAHGWTYIRSKKHGTAHQWEKQKKLREEEIETKEKSGVVPLPNRPSETYENNFENSNEVDNPSKGSLLGKAYVNDAFPTIIQEDLEDETYDSPVENPNEVDNLGQGSLLGRAYVNNAFPATLQKDFEDDTPSVASTRSPSIFSTNSMSLFSQYSAQDLESAIEELVTLLANDEVLKPLYLLAVQSKSIGGDRLENNLRRLLGSYSYDLGKTAKDALERGAAHLVRSRARYAANAIRRKFELRNEDVGIVLSVREESNISSDEDGLDESDGEDIPSLTQVKLFMVSGDAFDNLRRNLQNFVCPEKAQEPLQLPMQQEKVEQSLSQRELETEKPSAPSSTLLSPIWDESKLTLEQLAKPSQSYHVLIHETLSDCPAEAMSLPKIYQAIEHRYPYFKFHPQTLGWQSSVRHNLLQHPVFVKIKEDETGWMWGLNPDVSIEKERERGPSSPPSMQYSHPRILGRDGGSMSKFQEDDLEEFTSQEIGDDGKILDEDGNVVDRATVLPDKAQALADRGSLKRPCFNDQGRIFYLTPGTSIPNPGYVDGVKQFIELSFPDRHINWWPLKPLDTGCPGDHTRISWYCVCY